MNYTLAEYASDVVYRIANVCNARGIEHPVIVSESGRAIAAHHSLLICDVLGSSQLDRFRDTDADEQLVRAKKDIPVLAALHVYGTASRFPGDRNPRELGELVKAAADNIRID